MEETRKAPSPSIIGIFDSGVGGLSVWKELIKVVPGNPMLYLSDNAYCPYGPRTQEEVIARTKKISDFFISKGAEIIVVACNTATAAAIDALRKNYDVPFIGMEPAVKPAALHSKSGVIGVLATQGTFKGKLYHRTLERFASDVKVIEKIGTGLVELVESGETDTKKTKEFLKQYIDPMVAGKADHIVLGCTHYPFLKNAIQEVAGNDIVIVDPAPAVAHHTFNILVQNGMFSSEHIDPSIQTKFYSTGISDNLVRMVKSIIPSVPKENFYNNPL